MSHNHPSYGRSDPGDEHPGTDEPVFRIILNGKLFARRTNLGAAKAVIRRAQTYGTSNRLWSIMDGRKVMYRIREDHDCPLNKED